MGDGYLGKCKLCTKIDVTQNRKINAEHYRQYEKIRVSQRWEEMSKRTGLWRKRNPEKYYAHTILNNAVRAGKVVRQSCQHCGNTAHAHHPDYSKPLDVIWLCPIHHSEEHKKQL